MTRRFALVLALVALCLPGVAGATEMRGEQRVLAIALTWGPQPFATEDLRRTVFDESSAWYREASYDQTWLTGDVTPWLNGLAAKPECDTKFIRTAAYTAAEQAGYRLASYARFVIVHPRIEACPFRGLGSGENAFLNGALNRFLVVHELGHTYGLTHSNTWDCPPGGPCRETEYGNPYAVMGHGEGHYTAWDKFQLGWLTNVTAVEASTTYDLYRLETKAPGPQALKVTTARDEYWLEYRGETERRFGSRIPGGVLINAGTNPYAPLDLIPEFSSYNLLLPDPLGTGRTALVAGDRYAVPGVFELSVAANDAAVAKVAFRWTDTVAPTFARPEVPRSAGRRQLEVSWAEPKESGSGVLRYEVFLNGKPAATVRLDGLTLGTAAFVKKPKKGTHLVGVVAVDRAGNRSKLATRRFRIR